MSIEFRHYNSPADYKHVDDFLIEHYQPENADGNRLEPAWEYMHGHPYLDGSSLERIGMWEENGTMAAVSTYYQAIGFKKV